MKKQINDNVNSKKFVEKYFVDGLNTAVNEMSYGEMQNLLVELAGTKYWVAMIKYTQDRMTIAQSSLCMLNPMTQAVEMARAQGIISGLLDTQDMVGKTKESIAQQEAAANAKNDQSPDVQDEEAPAY